MKPLRQVRCLSHEEFAFAPEVNRTYISGIERGIRNPTVLIVAKVAPRTGGDADRLLTESLYAQRPFWSS